MVSELRETEPDKPRDFESCTVCLSCLSARTGIWCCHHLSSVVINWSYVWLSVEAKARRHSSERNSAMSSRRTPTKLDRFIAKRGSRLPYEPRGRPRERRDCASHLAPLGIKCHPRILNMFLKRWQIKKIWLTLFWNICFFRLTLSLLLRTILHWPLTWPRERTAFLYSKVYKRSLKRQCNLM